MSSPANALMCSRDSHSENVMISERSPSSRRSIHAPRLPGVSRYPAIPVLSMYSAYSAASARRTTPLHIRATTSPTLVRGGQPGSDQRPPRAASTIVATARPRGRGAPARAAAAAAGERAPRPARASRSRAGRVGRSRAPPQLFLGDRLLDRNDVGAADRSVRRSTETLDPARARMLLVAGERDRVDHPRSGEERDEDDQSCEGACDAADDRDQQDDVRET